MEPTSFEQRCSQVLEMLGWKIRPMSRGEAPGLVLRGTRRISPAVVEIGCQCKADPDTLITSEQVRDFAGALLQAGLNQGWFFTLSDFTQESHVAAQQINAGHALSITLLSGQKLSRLEEDAIAHRELLAKELLAFQQETSADLSSLRGEIGELRRAQERSQKKIVRGLRYQIAASAAILGLLAGAYYSQRAESPRPQAAGVSGSSEAFLPAEVAGPARANRRARLAKAPKAAPLTEEDRFLRALPALGRALRAGTLCDHMGEIQRLSLFVQRVQPQTSYDNARLWNSIESEIVNCVPGFSEDGGNA